MSAGGTALRALRWALWYLREVTGDSAYEQYCARHRERHPGEPVPTARQYQRLQAERREAASPSRCC
ncbi:YbdD/YjiX family protein [Streptomyces sp. LE64]|uniref:YbdD/YjiX family protein n=1 Tax=Streptomyces sp. LE64 TaxID=3448653 RepID=UPI004040F830